ncbi:MAG: hypothetical protein GY938_03280 [Ketobacter sp.]|nr:hypothetical protein [Ketobacter sp.]
MNRRGFLKSLGALAVAASLPAAVVTGWREVMRIEGERFLLSKPMVLTGMDEFVIRRCSFIAAPDFVGDYLLILDNPNAHSLIERCYFDCGGAGAIKFNTPQQEPQVFIT